MPAGSRRFLIVGRKRAGKGCVGPGLNAFGRLMPSASRNIWYRPATCSREVSLVDDGRCESRLKRGRLQRVAPAHAPSNRADLGFVDILLRGEVSDRRLQI